MNAATNADTGVTDTQRRRALAEPILAKLYNWIVAERPKLVDDSPFAKAMNYLVNQPEPLARFLDDGQLRLDNNISEVELRRLVVGTTGLSAAATMAPSGTPSPPRSVGGRLAWASRAAA